MIFSKSFKNKTVLVTGHTGFKGSWLALWLHMLGAKVIAISKDVPTEPSHYENFNDFFISDNKFNLNDFDHLCSIINKSKPEFVFHLAAQPLVLESYNDPFNTYNSNTIATLNILESLKRSNHKSSAIIITSDKCYENINKKVKYKENDRLGGIDPYSTSKAAAELVIRGYYESFFKNKNSNVRICSARAGNVMGGGDWAKDRIIPDCIKSWVSNKKVKIRNAKATRPWQHVLEPLSGYLTLATLLKQKAKLNGESFNFGPSGSSTYTVENLVSEVSKFFPNSKWEIEKNKKKLYEASLLSLDCRKSHKMLNWKSKLNFKQTAEWTSRWYNTYYNESPKSAIKLTIEQIKKYSKLV